MSPVTPPPVLLIGIGRSGSTALFRTLALHEDLGWFSNYQDRLPGLPALAFAHRAYGPALASLDNRRDDRGRRRRHWAPIRLLPQPSEAYGLWSRLVGPAFATTVMANRTPTPAERARCLRVVRETLRWQGKRRFVAKFSGPTRIPYLLGLFPDAVFVYVLREPLAVLRSALRVPFLHLRDPITVPDWPEALDPNWEQEWAQYDRSAVALAALQYRGLMRRFEQERRFLAPAQLFELHYEHIVSDPVAAISGLLEHCGLPPSPRMTTLLETTERFTNMNSRTAHDLSAQEQAVVRAVLST